MSLTRTEIQEIVSQIQIQPNWELHLLEDQIYRSKDFAEGRLYLQIQFDDIDNVTGAAGYRAHCRKWYLSEHMTKQEVVRTAWKAYEAAVLHEAQEKFLYRGRMIYGPHMDVDTLWSVAEKVEHRVGEQPAPCCNIQSWNDYIEKADIEQMKREVASSIEQVHKDIEIQAKEKFLGDEKYSPTFENILIGLGILEPKRKHQASISNNSTPHKVDL